MAVFTSIISLAETYKVIHKMVMRKYNKIKIKPNLVKVVENKGWALRRRECSTSKHVHDASAVVGGQTKAQINGVRCIRSV
ncbi:MAG: hypothetical protein DHS20C07_04860 [Methyloligella sp.]|nr:MAG: hypothetical protein DHS20C07_04860 [Methyloligella sp.]